MDIFGGIGADSDLFDRCFLYCMLKRRLNAVAVTGALMNICNSSDAVLVPAGKSGVIAAVMDAMRSHQVAVSTPFNAVSTPFNAVPTPFNAI